ncbi:MAG: imidazole glycerol phosphate synthase subunit HisH [Candidatus Viridilinea halotolerans]|uniref:Imidazole glycerol phosphate synthase subunit HisH n=1 Tax=Candidatus Viridilinea halotolerans TaxID=2491704 RepID=A0A426U847_9CHLR|nr:MAG: imidazole glycerol phosphate synthase subunit HisH [Candidatus Viridilinea halotolerans]
MPIAVINYGAGNLPNAVRALQAVGADLVVTADPDVVRTAAAVVLPGVGATADTMANLRDLGMDRALPEVVATGRPFLGICVGMQVLLATSEEFGHHPCLGLVAGTVTRLPTTAGKIPQIGWNQVCYSPTQATHLLFADIPDESHFYFVHSFYCDVADPALVAARTTYGLAFPSVIIRGNMAAVQFHPEKSGRLGLQLLRNFVHLAQG